MSPTPYLYNTARSASVRQLVDLVDTAADLDVILPVDARVLKPTPPPFSVHDPIPILSVRFAADRSIFGFSDAGPVYSMGTGQLVVLDLPARQRLRGGDNKSRPLPLFEVTSARHFQHAWDWTIRIRRLDHRHHGRVMTAEEEVSLLVECMLPVEVVLS